jgi:MYXO-CTERM domain-containing protein
VREIYSTAACIVACTALATPASAHVCMLQPPSRVGSDCSAASPQKIGPCGVNQRGSTPAVFQPGATITVQLKETIDHPSHYRIAFNPDGDAFEDPTSKDDNTGAHPFVLKDNITDEPADTQSVQVTLPNVRCESCTLQLIQVMYDKGDNGFGGNDGPGGKADNDDIYYACADIALRDDAASGDAGALTDAGVQAQDGGAADADSGSQAADPAEDGCSCSTAKSQPRFFGTALLTGALLLRRRRMRALFRR